ncbi:FAM183A and FAM183B related-domain-containing protein [Chytridium lagenaria]|nr:FAM183A and FAM183B related-domain-containing protein [Chytridium lagenaria]
MGDNAKGATGASVEKNAIFFDRIQAETIKKELRVHKLYENYMLSPSIKNNLVITNTPNTMNVQTKNEIEDEEYLTFSKKNALTPRDRLPVPVTSSQVYGWDPTPLFRTTDTRFYHPRCESEITKMYGCLRR